MSNEMTVEEMGEQVVAALAADAGRTDRGGDRAYSGKVWDRKGVRVYVRSSSGEDIGYIEILETGHNYRGIKRGASACQDAVTRGIALLSVAA